MKNNSARLPLMSVCLPAYIILKVRHKPHKPSPHTPRVNLQMRYYGHKEVKESPKQTTNRQRDLSRKDDTRSRIRTTQQRVLFLPITLNAIRKHVTSNYLRQQQQHLRTAPPSSRQPKQRLPASRRRQISYPIQGTISRQKTRFISQNGT